jgi:hypothetical protein
METKDRFLRATVVTAVVLVLAFGLVVRWSA